MTAIARRKLLAALAGAAAWPIAASAQQAERMRRIGVLMNRAADDPRGQHELAAFQKALQQLGWSNGGNLRIDTRWGQNDVDRNRRYAAELIALAPHAVLASGTQSVAALQHASRTLPIVFVAVSDPVGAPLVDTLARPRGNATGFMTFEYRLSGKWLELLKEIAPGVRRTAVLRDAANPAGIAQFVAIGAAAQSLKVEIRPIDITLGLDVPPMLLARADEVIE